MDMGYPESIQTDSSATAQEAPAAGASTQERQAKKIRTGSITAETQDFDTARQALEELVEELGGYFASRSVRNWDAYRYADFTIRIPAGEFDAFWSRVGESFHVTQMSDNEEDITNLYYDVQGRLTTQQNKLKRLQELLLQAESMEDIITIESAISDTELAIEQLTGQLQGYDDQVDYATITMTLEEVYQLSSTQQPVTSFWGKLGERFVDGLRNVGDALQSLAFFVVYNWVWLLLLAGIGWGGVVLVRRRWKKRTKPQQPPKDS